MFRQCLLFALLMFTVSCHSEKKANTEHFRGVVMTIPYHITIGQPLSKADIQKVRQIIEMTFEEVNLLYNKWNPNSELSRINQTEAFREIPLSPELFQVLLQVDQMVALSEKRFDPTIEPVQQLWKQSLENGQIPFDEALNAELAYVGWEKFHFTNAVIWKEYSESSLDLGGIAKGFAIDLIAQRL